jgi:hypothetical protein
MFFNKEKPPFSQNIILPTASVSHRSATGQKELVVWLMQELKQIKAEMRSEIASLKK